MKYLVSINVCLLAVSAVVCVFETSDPSSPELRAKVRPRRDADAEEKPYFMCCHIEQPEGLLDRFYKVEEELIDCLQGGDRHDKETMLKAMKCLAKKRGMINDADEFQEDEIKKRYKNAPMTEHQKAIVDDVVHICIAEATEGEKQSLPKFHSCVMKEFFKACPADLQDTSEFCQDIREGKDTIPYLRGLIEVDE